DSLSATAGRARHRRDHLERLGRPVSADRRPRADAGASRHPVRRSTNAMTPTRLTLAGLATVQPLSLGGCTDKKVPGFQGWMEADLIFVAPDEVGRIQTLSVLEGDHVEVGAPLFTVDDDLQKADLQMQQAS